MKAKIIPGIPLQAKGAFHDTESQRDFPDTEITAQKYAQLKERFLDMDRWQKYCGEGSADFKLYNSAGKYINRNPQVGDFVRIDIPGPGNFQAEDYDWVEVETISEQYSKSDEIESCLIICRPSKAPLDDNKQILHFYSQESTSCFRIARGSNFIRVGIYGRNEIPNSKNVGILNKIRSFLISIGGFLKATKIQWKCIADGMIDF